MKRSFQFLILAAAMIVGLSAMGRAQDISRTPQPFDPDRSSSATEATIRRLERMPRTGLWRARIQLASGRYRNVLGTEE